VVLVVGVEGCDKLDRTQKILDRTQFGIALILECAVRIVLVCDSCCSTPTLV
jgi:hypothetical protein